MKNVPVIDARQAVARVRSGDKLLVGGFGMTGTPVHLLHALAETDVTNLVFIGNNFGEPGLGGSRLLRNRQVRKAVGSFFTSNPEAVAAIQSGEIEAELVPQGTFAEALRAGGAMDLASGAKRLVVTMTHTDKDGASKVVENCDLPLTARAAVDMLITDLAVFEFDDGGMTLTALMPGSSLEDVKRHTTANYRISDGLESAAVPR